MKNPTIKQVAFLSVVFFGWRWSREQGTSPFPSRPDRPMTTWSSASARTLTSNVGSISGVGEVNEIDVRMTSIGGTYGTGATPIPATTGINGIYGTWYFQGTSAAAYVPASRNAPELALTTNGASVSGSITTAPAIGGAANAPIAPELDTVAPAPGQTASGAMTANSQFYAATQITGGYFTTWQKLQRFLHRPDPRRNVAA